jgi:hypothetical protein
MKAGTSWIFEMLRNHPSVETVPIKEIHYFWHIYGNYRFMDHGPRIETTRFHLNRLLGSTKHEDVESLLDWFKIYLSDPVDDEWFANLFRYNRTRVCAEFSNTYALLPAEAWTHVRKMAEKIKVLYTLRNPLHRLWSHCRFQAELSGALSDIQGWNANQYTQFMEIHGIFSAGRYSDAINNLRSNFSRSEYIIGYYDDIIQSPHSFLRKIENLLQIENFEYSKDIVDRIHNPSVALPAPKAFIEAATPFVQEELERIGQKIEFIPSTWLDLNVHQNDAAEHELTI